MRSRFPEIIASLFILLFVYTAISKMTGHAQFERALASSPLLGFAASALSWMIPAAELLTSILLLLPRLRLWGLIGSFFLMAAFTLYIGCMVLFSPQLPCTCGGVISSLSWNQHLMVNLALLALAAAGIALTICNQDFVAINRGSRKPVQTSRQIHH